MNKKPMKFTYYIFLSLFILFPLTTAKAQDEQKKTFNTFTLYWENDGFMGTDRDYTNGLKLTLSTPYKTDKEDSHLPGWSYPIINRLPFVNDPKTKRALSISISQEIYTPEDTQQSDLQVNDRPYTGITYFGIGFHSKSSDRKSSLEFNVGILGPHSYAEQIQNFGHDLTNSASAKGWNNQLDDEPTFEGILEFQWRLFRLDRGRSFSSDCIPHLGGRIGNVRTYVNAGLEVRFGWNLPRNFGTCPLLIRCETNNALDDRDIDFFRSGRFGIHFFAAVDGRAVLQDIFLDGNTFEDSHSVDKEMFVADLMAGIALIRGNIRATYTYVFRTKQFETQDYDQIFGAISVSYSY